MTKLSESSIDFLVSNLTSKIEKLDLFDIPCLNDEHVKELVTRCNKITDLNLGGRNSITKQSMNFIIEHLQLTLVKLGVKSVQFNCLISVKSNIFHHQDLDVVRCKYWTFISDCVTRKYAAVA